MATVRTALYRAMLSEARRQRLPKRYRTDLTRHDRDHVSAMRSASVEHHAIGWRLYDLGTHLVTGATLASTIETMACDRMFPGPESGYYLVKGESLEQVSKARWIEALTEKQL